MFNVEQKVHELEVRLTKAETKLDYIDEQWEELKKGLEVLRSAVFSIQGELRDLKLVKKLVFGLVGLMLATLAGQLFQTVDAVKVLKVINAVHARD